ncbi:hypothetical protein THAPSDRAFT_29166 [Thalassiosira pseudonana CCMP1335]|uniref:Uncharacterized protein n=1 Tax=Thalassiosira pseudonana TaxID=35128 RepID=B8C6Y7_THAPS|nr:hypothetical protein THAPSDRAFT_29166 [Thalassiosira pseudonana CCMP1335]EED90887.1 hypothetical protein THAPSDRAFT_29166 [Thalassiosira pseudonana CCMP1335]
MSKYGSIPTIHDHSVEVSDGDAIIDTSRNGGTSDPLFSSRWVKAAAIATAVLLAFALFPTNASSSSSSSTKTILDTSHSGVNHDDNQAMFYADQLVNHFHTDRSITPKDAKWSNRYYQSTKYYKGPGSPIFLIVGGEGALDSGILYPFVSEHLARRFGAAVIQIEHRFYGPFQPIVGREATVLELLELLTPQQALADMVQLTKHFKELLGCSEFDRHSKKYCPVISVGGSYPGFLSAMFRLVYPDFVDISYASSAPLKLYDQTANQNVYYDIVTKAAEHTSPGCAKSVRDALEEASELILKAPSVIDAVKSMSMCVDSIPEYIDNLKTLKEDVMMAIGFSFADYDMDAYPPGKDLGLYKACRVFQHNKSSSMEKVAKFFELLGTDTEFEREYPTLVGEEEVPDFQLCTTLVDPIGFSSKSMFPKRKWTYEGLTKYCQSRYGSEVTPQPYALVEDMGFDDLVGKGASRILFTNGLQDMWSGASYLETVSEANEILSLNFENGAHHSDLSHVGPSDNDSEDIRLGFVKITNILAKWLDEIKVENKKGHRLETVVR